MQDDLNGRQPQWKTTSMEDKLNGKKPQWTMTSLEDEMNGRQPQKKMTILACLVSQFCSKLGPAQPQIVSCFY